MTAGLDGIEAFKLRVEAWARHHCGSGAAVRHVRRMGGNSGITFGFDVIAGGKAERLVMRLAPSGVAHRGNSDVLRQAVILKAMHAAGIPVPEIRWAESDPRWFGVPFFIAERVEGKSTQLFNQQEAQKEDGEGLEPVFRDAMGILARIHAIEWTEYLPSWGPPRTLPDEVSMWVPTLHKSRDSPRIARTMQLHDILLAKGPDVSLRPGIVHGDFYSNNWLYDGSRITAILDWEIAAIGHSAIDVGWICMMYDDESWGPVRHRWKNWCPSTAFLVESYASGGGNTPDALPWYRAFAGYKLACIAAFRIRLHCEGKRRDPAWEIIDDSFDCLLDRAMQLLS